MWVFAAIGTAAGAIVLCGCGGLCFISFLGGGSGPNPSSQHSSDPPTDPNELVNFGQLIRHGEMNPGTPIPARKFTLDCSLTQIGGLNFNQQLALKDLVLVRMPLGLPPNTPGYAFLHGYAERRSSTGTKLASLLTYNAPRRISVEVNTPRKQMPLDGMIEITRVWEWVEPKK
jgi:hypothetical protein